MIVDPEHQRSPSVRSIKNGKGHRLGNPCPYEKQIAQCSSCKDHFFMPEIKDGVCMKCLGHEIGNANRQLIKEMPSSMSEDSENVTSSASSQQPAS